MVTRASIKLLYSILFILHVRAFIHPIEIQGKHFVDSFTQQPFFIKGLDYQPGGSSKVDGKQDPLSDPQKCARDIMLFQQLGINTIRIYSLNPDLNHDVCMTMLAAAGIYLLLDVNSPLQNQHLNRYEPWSSYSEPYLQHVFKLIEQFSHYNNTLGFFAGNEVVNDGRSAQTSPPYLKALVGDMKHYIARNSPRPIPVGYSAVDDLKFRVSLARYLECYDANNKYNDVDFYGVNSYQWCGQQTFQTSGYDKLVEAYRGYSKPVFFSEFGCNEVLPRQFQEVEALYSKDMYTVFSGGLVYEFNQEANNYGLVDSDGEGNIKLLPDFHTLKKVYGKVPMPTAEDLQRELEKDKAATMAVSTRSRCAQHYDNLEITIAVPNLANSMIRNGVKVEPGTYVDLSEDKLRTTYKIFDVNGKEILKGSRVEVVEVFDGSNLTKMRKLRRARYKNGAATSFPASAIVLTTIGIIELLFQFSVI
ncbi:AaceriADL175Wp [[Ashbya] aceris (nom. inval.)]|nr:AaceriADL175Wp [[Ashbya] aceris (nom. inval.)]